MSNPAARTKRSRANKKISNSLVALSSAAVLAVYTAGYLRTKPAADRLEVAAAQRRTVSVPPGIAAAPAAVPPLAPRPLVGQEPLVGQLPAAPISGAPTRASNEGPSGTGSSKTASSQTAPEPAAVLSAAPASAAASAPAPNDASTPQPSSTPPAMLAAELTASVAEPRTAKPVAAPPVPPRGEYNDGTYRGWGYSRHGDIQASVVVKGGRIVSADIAQCRTRYSCNWVEYLPDQVVSRQRALVDAVSGATESSFAFEDAVTAALSRAK